MHLDAAAVRLASQLATGAFGILALLTQYKDKEGRITAWGRVALVGIVVTSALSLYLIHLETEQAQFAAKTSKREADAARAAASELARRLAVLVQMASTSSKGIDASLKGQRQLEARQAQSIIRLQRLPSLIAKSSFPLEPLELFYSIEYPMDQQPLASYAKRLQAALVGHLRRAREGRRSTADDLNDEGVEFGLSSSKDWLPDSSGRDGLASSLLQDDTVFAFWAPGKGEPRTVTLRSTSPGMQGLIVTMRSQGQVEQHIWLFADFKRRVFIKRVRCRNPLRAGTDATAFSAIDLVGRTATWETEANCENQLTAFGFRFSYDYGFDQNYSVIPSDRTIYTAGRTSIRITGADIGLADVLSRH